MILCLTAAHTSVFNTPRKTFFWIKLTSEAFFSFASSYQKIFLKTFNLILFHLSMQFLRQKLIVLSHYGILAGAAVDINCENQLNQGRFLFCSTFSNLFAYVHFIKKKKHPHKYFESKQNASLILSWSKLYFFMDRKNVHRIMNF